MAEQTQELRYRKCSESCGYVQVGKCFYGLHKKLCDRPEDLVLGAVCKYDILERKPQTPTKCTSRAPLAALKGLDSDRGSHLLACNPE